MKSEELNALPGVDKEAQKPAELREDELAQIAGGTTGAEMANWAYLAYTEGWSFVWGSASPGAVDSSGLITSLTGGPHNSEALLAASPNSGPISTMPDVPGLGLYSCGHVGVYVGNSRVVNAVNESVGTVMETFDAHRWSRWFEIPGVSY